MPWKQKKIRDFRRTLLQCFVFACVQTSPNEIFIQYKVNENRPSINRQQMKAIGKEKKEPSEKKGKHNQFFRLQGNKHVQFDLRNEVS